jgi:hypothetical protein
MGVVYQRELDGGPSVALSEEWTDQERLNELMAVARTFVM